MLKNSNEGTQLNHARSYALRTTLFIILYAMVVSNKIFQCLRAFVAKYFVLIIGKLVCPFLGFLPQIYRSHICGVDGF